MRRDETRSKSRQWCPTVTTTRSRNRSKRGVSPTSICSRAVTRRRALLWTLLRSHTCGVAVAYTLWSGIGESKTTHPVMTTCPTIGQAGGPQSRTSSAVNRRDCKPARPDQSHVLAQSHIAQPHQIISMFQKLKSQNILLKYFMTRFLLENCFLSANAAVVYLSCVSVSVSANNRQTSNPFKQCQTYLIRTFQNLKSQNTSLEMFYD